MFTINLESFIFGILIRGSSARESSHIFYFYFYWDVYKRVVFQSIWRQLLIGRGRRWKYQKIFKNGMFPTCCVGLQCKWILMQPSQSHYSWFWSLFFNRRRIYGIEYLELYFSQSREAQHHRRQSGVSQDVIILHHDQALSLGFQARARKANILGTLSTIFLAKHDSRLLHFFLINFNSPRRWVENTVT